MFKFKYQTATRWSNIEFEATDIVDAMKQLPTLVGYTHVPVKEQFIITIRICNSMKIWASDGSPEMRWRPVSLIHHSIGGLDISDQDLK